MNHNYYRVRLGTGGMHVEQCLREGFIGVDYGLDIDLTGRLPDHWKEFNREFIPELQARFPGKSKVAAGLQCGGIWSLSKGLTIGDIVISPGDNDHFHVGEVTGEYIYAPDGPLCHRRPVHWKQTVVSKEDLTPELWASMRVPTTVVGLEKHKDILDQLLTGVPPVPKIIATSEDIEDPLAFAMEKHLEDFLVSNWAQTSLGRDFNIIEEDGELVGQQYLTDSGPLDILALSKDGKRLLVVELKRGRASDVVVGQILRYMGFVESELAEEGQTVEGVVIALEDDPRLQRALQMVPIVRFMRYEIQFRLVD